MAALVQLCTAPEATAVACAGGKGAVLARLLQAGVPVPPGCVLAPEALTTVLAAQPLALDAPADQLSQTVLTAAIPDALVAELQEALTTLGPAPHGWAVRSSALAEDLATASYAGVYDSLLAIPAAELWSAIRTCWAAWWSARAVAYRQQQGDTDPTPRLALLLQHLVPAHCAGVAFTVEPLSGDHTRLVIHAAPGLGVAVVAGVVQPEQYTLAKTPDLTLLETRYVAAPQAPLLTPEVLHELGTLCLRLERLCGRPQDIEWAWDGARCWIVQSRPITTLDEASPGEAVDVWGNANLKDVLPGLVSPLTWSLMQPQLDSLMRQQYEAAGYQPDPHRAVLRRFWGRAYFNVALFSDAAYALYGVQADEQTAQIGGLVPPRPTPPTPTLRQRLGWLRAGGHFLRVIRRAARQAPEYFATTERFWKAERHTIPFLPRGLLLQRMEQFTDRTDPLLLLHLYLGWGLSGNFNVLRTLVARALPQASSASVTAELVSGLGDVSSAEHSYHLWQLSRQARLSPPVMDFLERGDWATWPQALAGTAFLDAWQRFLALYGHRALYEIEMANPRWREDPAYLLTVLATYARLEQAQPPFDPQVQAQQRQAAAAEVQRHLSWGTRLLFRHILQRTQTFSRLRENSKSHLVQLIDLGRLLSLRAAQFLVEDGFLDTPEAVFLLEAEEVKHALRGTTSRAAIQQALAQRRLERQRDAARQMPDLFIGNRPVYAEALHASDTVLTGLPSNPGRVQGVARVLMTPHDGVRLQAGEILVAPSTDPGWTPLFLLASGLVMETGGYLSHGAIVAREYGIPAVINVPLATQRIVDGRTILLDGAQGTVHLLTEEEA